jgi:hypothetical protein
LLTVLHAKSQNSEFSIESQSYQDVFGKCFLFCPDGRAHIVTKKAYGMGQGFILGNVIK